MSDEAAKKKEKKALSKAKKGVHAADPTDVDSKLFIIQIPPVVWYFFINLGTFCY